MKTIFITGGNSGLGFETARQFLLYGDAVIIGCRDRLKGDIAADQLRSTTNSKNITTIDIKMNFDLPHYFNYFK